MAARLWRFYCRSFRRRFLDVVSRTRRRDGNGYICGDSEPDARRSADHLEQRRRRVSVGTSKLKCGRMGPSMLNEILRRSSMTWSLLLLLLAAMAGWISLGELHGSDNADSLLLVLISLQHWTLFFWGQDRFGMLTPLVMAPIRDPFINLLLQGWLTTLAALLTPFLAAYYIDRKTQWLAIGALANSLFLVFSLSYQFDWLVTQPYALSLSLAFGALIVASAATRVSSLVAAGLMLLAHWVNLSVCVVILPCILISRHPQFLRSLVVTVIGLSGGFILKQMSHPVMITTTLATVPPSQWMHGWIMLLRTTAKTVNHPIWLEMAIALAVSNAIIKWFQGSFRRSVINVITPVTIGVAYLMIVGTFMHVQLNDYYPRYALPCWLFMALALGTLIVAPLEGRRRVAVLVSLAVFVTAGMSSYGRPSIKQVRRRLDRNLGALTSNIIDTRATVMAGDYWTVWPAVFHANMQLYYLTGYTPIFGLTFRSELTDPIWLNRRSRDITILAQRSAESASALIASHGVPATLKYRTEAFDLFVVREDGYKDEVR